MKKGIVALLLFYSLMGNAQPPPYEEKPRKIKMPKFFRAELPKKSFPISTIEIRQAVWDSLRLGYLQKGLMNMMAEAIPPKDLTTFLQDYIDNQYEDGYKKTGSRLLIVVKELRVNERTFFSAEFAYARISADAWLSSGGELYKQIATIDTVITYNTMTDVSSLHGENIAKGLFELIMRAQNRAAANNFISSDEMTVQAILEKELKRFDQPILKTGNYKEGAYMSFREFLDNNPSQAVFETEVIDKKKIRITIEDQNNIRKQIQPWGISKGGEIYKYHEENLIPIEKLGFGFVISDYMQKASKRNSSIFVGAVLGGAIGGAIASGAGASKIYSVTSIPYITKKQPEASTINMMTGELDF